MWGGESAHCHALLPPFGGGAYTHGLQTEWEEMGPLLKLLVMAVHKFRGDSVQNLAIKKFGDG